MSIILSEPTGGTVPFLEDLAYFSAQQSQFQLYWASDEHKVVCQKDEFRDGRQTCTTPATGQWVDPPWSMLVYHAPKDDVVRAVTPEPDYLGVMLACFIFILFLRFLVKFLVKKN